MKKLKEYERKEEQEKFRLSQLRQSRQANIVYVQESFETEVFTSEDEEISDQQYETIENNPSKDTEEILPERRTNNLEIAQDFDKLFFQPSIVSQPSRPVPKPRKSSLPIKPVVETGSSSGVETSVVEPNSRNWGNQKLFRESIEENSESSLPL